MVVARISEREGKRLDNLLSGARFGERLRDRIGDRRCGIRAKVHHDCAIVNWTGSVIE